MKKSRKILIINGNPDKESLSTHLAEAYAKGALNAGNSVKVIHLTDLTFNPNLQNGYKKRTELEPCLQEALQDIKQADHLVFVYPNWWGTYPALLKGFIDRVFLPGHVFANRENSIFWDKLLKGKTARLIVTMDTPKWYYSLMFNKPGDNAMKKCVLHFCGVNTVKIKHFTPTKRTTIEQRQKWLSTTQNMGYKAE